MNSLLEEVEMKRKWNTVLTLLAAISITLAGVGCGSNSEEENLNPNGVGAPGVYGGGVHTLPGGVSVVTFNGTNVYDSGVTVYGTNYSTGYAGQNSISFGSPALPIGQPGTIVSNSFIFPGTQLQLVKTPGSSTNYSNLSAVLNLSSAFTSTHGQISNLQMIDFRFYPQGSSGAFKIYLCCATNPMTGQSSTVVIE